MRRMGGTATRLGLYKCCACRNQSRVTVGTVFESSHVKLHHWLQAAYLMCSSKRGISSNQLARTLGVTVKTGWFMSLRLREAMASGKLPPMGGDGAVVEIDETFIGQRKDMPEQRGYAHKHAVLKLVERSGSARSLHVEGLGAADLLPIIKANVHPVSSVMTDEASHYDSLGKLFAAYDYTRYGAGEYVRGLTHTNTVGGFYNVSEHGMKGDYHHCFEKHLHRYVAEFDFRYSNWIKLGVGDAARIDTALRGVVGKRLMYRDLSCAA